MYSSRQSQVTAERYILGYTWGMVEAFVHDDSITIQCLPKAKDEPGRLWEATMTRPEGLLIRERSYIPDKDIRVFVTHKDCDDPTELRPNLASMLDNVPRDIGDTIKSAFDL